MGIKSVKIQLYKKSRTKNQVLNKFGDYILDSICISCSVEENLSTTEYFLEAEFYVDNEGLYKCIEEDAILKVKIDYGEELFSIVDIKKTPTRVIVFARQITITESMCTWMDDVRPENKNGHDALNHMGQNAIGLHNLEFESDIDKTNTAFYQNQTLYDSLHISENCFAIRWGGEVKRRGYKIIINEKLGEDRNVQIRSGKNLVGFEASTNIDTIITRIKPVGYNGITINGYVDSPLINNYKYVRTQTMKYEHVKLASDVEEGSSTEEGDLIYNTLAEAQQKLTELALSEFLDSIDTVQAEYIINFIDLSTTEEYKNYAQAEFILLGDIVHVYEVKHDINIAVRAISRKYNILAQRTIEITLSNKAIVGEQAQTIEQLKSRLDDVLENIGYMKVKYVTVEELDAINAEIENLEAGKAYISDLEATNLIVESLKANKVDIADLDIANKDIEDLKQNKADKTDLQATNQEVAQLKANKADISALQETNEEVEQLRTTKANVADLQNIEKEVNNLKTTKANVSALQEINETVAQLEITKANAADLINVTEDVESLDKDLETIQTLINGNLTSANIKELTLTAGKVTIDDGLITNDMINDNANISGGKIYLEEQEQTLEEAFNNLQDKVNNIETSGGDLTDISDQVKTNTSNIEEAQGQINELINNTTITKEDDTVVLLKDEFNSTKDTVDSHSQAISDLTNNYSSLNGLIEELQKTIEELEKRVQELEGNNN